VVPSRLLVDTYGGVEELAMAKSVLAQTGRQGDAELDHGLQVTHGADEGRHRSTLPELDHAN
jgi:hypothetical protein